MRSDRERLLDILEAIEKIEAYKEHSRSEFDADELLQVWFVHHLQIIGEVASRISEDTRTKYPQLPCGQMIGMRHILVHGYFEVDQECGTSQFGSVKGASQSYSEADGRFTLTRIRSLLQVRVPTWNKLLELSIIEHIVFALPSFSILLSFRWMKLGTALIFLVAFSILGIPLSS